MKLIEIGEVFSNEMSALGKPLQLQPNPDRRSLIMRWEGVVNVNASGLALPWAYFYISKGRGGWSLDLHFCITDAEILCKPEVERIELSTASTNCGNFGSGWGAEPHLIKKAAIKSSDWIDKFVEAVDLERSNQPWTRNTRLFGAHLWKWLPINYQLSESTKPDD
jgi:hypothetical protein